MKFLNGDLIYNIDSHKKEEIVDDYTNAHTIELINNGWRLISTKRERWLNDHYGHYKDAHYCIQCRSASPNNLRSKYEILPLKYGYIDVVFLKGDKFINDNKNKNKIKIMLMSRDRDVPWTIKALENNFRLISTASERWDDNHISHDIILDSSGIKLCTKCNIYKPVDTRSYRVLDILRLYNTPSYKIHNHNKQISKYGPNKYENENNNCCCIYCKTSLPKKLVNMIKNNSAKCPICNNLYRCRLEKCNGIIVSRYVDGKIINMCEICNTRFVR